MQIGCTGAVVPAAVPVPPKVHAMCCLPDANSPASAPSLLLSPLHATALLVHSTTLTGWDMFTHSATVVDALHLAADQLAGLLHMLSCEIAERLASALPSIAGAYLLPLVNQPLEKAVDARIKRAQEVLRPASMSAFRRDAVLPEGPCGLAVARDVLLLLCWAGGVVLWRDVSGAVTVVCERLGRCTVGGRHSPSAVEVVC